MSMLGLVVLDIRKIHGNLLISGIDFCEQASGDHPQQAQAPQEASE